MFSAQGRYAQKLLNDLMENYSNALRPVEDTDKALNVTLQITLSQIKDMVSSKHTHRSVCPQVSQSKKVFRKPAVTATRKRSTVDNDLTLL